MVKVSYALLYLSECFSDWNLYAFMLKILSQLTCVRNTLEVLVWCIEVCAASRASLFSCAPWNIHWHMHHHISRCAITLKATLSIIINQFQVFCSLFCFIFISCGYSLVALTDFFKPNKRAMMALNRSPEFNSSNPKPSAAELFGTWGHHLSELRRAQLCNPLYQISSIWAKWYWNCRFFSYCLCISMLQTQEPLAYGHFGPSDLDLNKIGKGPLGNAIYLISSIWGK